MSPMVVCVFLVRMEPFTTSLIHFQGGRFDVPDRTFSSIALTYAGLLYDASEYWELPPEFFFCPEFLRNLNKFDLGTISGSRIEDVKLPKWAANATEFVYLHRKALESDFVSENLNKWIDLLWGVDQRNQERDNVYDWHLYKDVWRREGVDPVECRAFLKLVGQIPPKLFKAPHPTKRRPAWRTRQFRECRLYGLRQVDGLFTSGRRIWVLGRFDGLFLFSLETSSLSKRRGLPEVSSVTFCGNCLIAQCSDSSWLQMRNEGDTRIILDRTIVSIAADGEWIALTSADFITAIYSIYLNRLVCEFRSYQGLVLCSAVSETFKVHVAGISDGSLEITSLTTGESIKVISLEGMTPRSVFVTACWGFIVACVTDLIDGAEQSSLVVYSVNGEMIRRQVISGVVSQVTVFASVKGFDYCAFIVKGSAFVCEVFYLDIRPLNRFVGHGATGFLYNQELGGFIVAGASNTLTFVPFLPDDTPPPMKRRLSVA
jgi:hypothetical protein